MHALTVKMIDCRLLKVSVAYINHLRGKPMKQSILSFEKWLRGHEIQLVNPKITM